MDWRSNAAVAEIKLVGWVKMGVPYPDIANRLGTSVGAVCGKVHRMGIGRGPRKPDRLYLKAKRPRNPQLTPDAAYFEIMERQEKEAQARQGLTVTLDTSEDHHCRYVIGDPTKRQLCGAQRIAGTPYCQEHAALCLSRYPLKSIPGPALPGRRTVDLSGQRFGRLLVLHLSGYDGHQHALFVCQCDCGKQTQVMGTALTWGSTTSCGCYHREMMQSRETWRSTPIARRRAMTPVSSVFIRTTHEAIDPRTFEEADAPEPVTIAA